MGDVEGGRHATGAGWTDAAGFRVGGDDEDIQVAGTHFRVLVAVFFGAFGSRTGDVEGGRHVTGAGWTDAAGFRVEVMRRSQGRRVLISVCSWPFFARSSGCRVM
jgi:hypothetical protein